MKLISSDDFNAITLGLGMREVVVESGDPMRKYDAEALSGESVREFFKRTAAEIPHYYSAPEPDTADEAALYSVDAQCRYAKANGDAALLGLLKSNGLTPGKVLPPIKEDPAKAKGEANPWSPKFKGTEAERAAKLASIMRQGTKFAASMAKAAGKTITGADLKV